MLPTREKGGRTFQAVGEITALSRILCPRRKFDELIGRWRETRGQNTGW